MMWGYDDSGWWWVVMAFGMIAFWAIVAWVVVSVWRGERRESTPPDAERILAERYANGEIDGDEYQQRLGALRSASAEAMRRAV